MRSGARFAAGACLAALAMAAVAATPSLIASRRVSSFS